MAWFRRDAHPEEQLSAYVDGELSLSALRAMEAHLAACEACSALAEELRETKSLVAALPRQETARAFTLGPQFAVPARSQPARRSSFTFAPVAALTVLVALLFVDAANFSGMSSSSEDAGSTAGARQTDAIDKGEEGGAAGGTQTFEAPAAAESTANQSTTDSALTPQPTPAPAAASGATPPSAQAGQDRAATDDDATEEPATLTVEPDGEESDGISTLRVLQIVAALALVFSLGVVYLPRVLRR
ncbi:MAG TPA: zf-HC2 domain-containing protein [Dehalococcoidia bacterium]|jgi:hypothetical protein|nr:zf-HC2 domain-containing protein [Dehalococcoidia bacterium]